MQERRKGKKVSCLLFIFHVLNSFSTELIQLVTHCDDPTKHPNLADIQAIRNKVSSGPQQSCCISTFTLHTCNYGLGAIQVLFIQSQLASW